MAMIIKKSHYNYGFTIVELLVALALGIIISAAALQLFTGGMISARMQQASSELQDSGLFGLEYMAKDIRLTNYGNVSHPVLNDQTVSGGIVLTQAASGNVNLLGNVIAVTDITNANGLSNVKVGSANNKSDQLTIQFIAPNKMVNCEGKTVEKDEFVIQRYFLRKDDNGQDGDLALACDANLPPATSAAGIKGFGGANQGEIIMPRVDHLKFYLGTQSDKAQKLGYYTIANYLTSANAARVASKEPPRIVSVKIEVIVRSRDSTASKMVDPSKGILGVDETSLQPSDDKTAYLRRQYVTTVALRNALGEAL